MPIDFDERDVGQTRRLNAVLAYVPRLKLHAPLHRSVAHGLTKLSGKLLGEPPGRHGVAAEDRRVESRGRAAQVRILTPRGPVRGVHLHFHGGGWTIGDARMDDTLNARLAAERGIAVVAVDYRLIPAASFAAMLDDCETAALWVLESGLTALGAETMTIGGESAGGHLAAVTLLRLRDRGAAFDRVVGAALLYGCYDLGDTERRRLEEPETLVLHAPTLAKLVDKATGLDVAARRDPALSPLRATLDGLPPALFIVGDRDPLQEDSELMHAKWRAQSGSAELIVVPEAPHGFNHMKTSAAAKTNGYVRAWLAARFAGSV